MGVCVNNYSSSVEFKSPFFKPMNWCNKQWSNWAHLPQNKSKIASILKRIAVFVPLVLATTGAAFVALIGVVLSPCRYVIIRNTPIKNGSGIQAEKIHNLNTQLIKEIDFQGSGILHISFGDHNSLKVQGDDNLIDHFAPRTENSDKLILGGLGTIPFRAAQPIRYNLTLAAPLNSVKVSGSGQIHISSLNTPSFSCNISGSGKVHLNNGNVENQTVKIAGSGTYISNLDTKHSKIDISGSGKAEVKAHETLVVNVSGSGNCQYLGNPRVTKTISGSGSVNKVN